MRPQSNPRASWASGDDNAVFYAIVSIVGCAVLSYMLWTNYHGTISAIVIAVRHGEIELLRHMTDRYDLADRQMAAANPNDVTLGELYGISRDLGRFVRIPAAGLILVLAAVCMVRAAPSRYRRPFDLDGLVREQARSFPTTAAFASRHLRLVAPPAAGPRAADYALSPEEWITLHATASDGGFDEVAARGALVTQLGPRWQGIARASAPVRCLLAAFALHLSERRADALRLLGAVSAGLRDGKDDNPEGPLSPLEIADGALAQADAIIADAELVAPALLIAGRHAYAHTALMDVLNEARLKAGVLAPGQFAWLKLVDRPLWYALHSLGFETEGAARYQHPNPRAEAAGARDHWAVERIAGEPVIEPDLDRAIHGLRRVVAARKPASSGQPA